MVPPALSSRSLEKVILPAADSTQTAMAVAASSAASVTDLDDKFRRAALEPFHGLNGRFGLAVKELGSGQAVYLNETAAFQAASLYKLPVMYEVFRLRAQDQLSFQENLTISANDASYDLGTLLWPAGTVMTLGTALERMVTISDNTSAYILTRRVGSARTNEDMLGLGLRQTVIRSDELATSALDMIRLLELLASGRAVDSASSAEMIQLMARGRIHDRIPALLPAEAVVANKTGNWERAVHDVALVYGPRSTLALAFLSDDVADYSDVYAAMARAARNLYDLTNAPDYPGGPQPTAPPDRPGYAAPPRLPAPTATLRPTPRPIPTLPDPTPRTELPVAAEPAADSTPTTQLTAGPIAPERTLTPGRATPTDRHQQPTAAPTEPTRPPRPTATPPPTRRGG
jgi:beta-lactamase class A